MLFNSHCDINEGHSITHTTCELVTKTPEGFHNRKYIVGAFLDQSKAFAAIDHNILLYRLRHYRIRWIVYQLVGCYLEDRKHYAEYKGNVQACLK